jgi:hypothetical protein
MLTSRLEIRAKRQPLLCDVIEVIRSGSFHLDDIAIRPLLGESEILDMDEHVSVEDAVAFLLIRRGADKMDLARRSTTAFYGLPEVSDLSRNISLPLLVG